MDSIGTAIVSRLNHLIDIEIALGCLRWADEISFIGVFGEERVFVCLGMDSNGRNTHFPAGPHNANSDFSAIGHKNLFYHLTVPP